MYSFSTCWNSHRHTDGRAMLREIRDLGFEYAELMSPPRLMFAPPIPRILAVPVGLVRLNNSAVSE